MPASRSFLHVVVLTLLAWSLAPAARAQIAFIEGADLNGQNLGTVSPGLNTVRGQISANIIVGGQIFGDFEDRFTFTIPGGLRASSVQLAIANYTQVFATSGVFISGPGVSTEVFFSANGSVNLTGPLNPGTYSVNVFANNFDDSAGSISFTHETRITAQLDNNACASPAAAALGATAFSTAAATTDGPTHPLCAARGDSNINRDVWFVHTAPATGQITAETCGSAFDTKIAVYSSANCATLASTILACNDDACGSQSRVQWVATAGQQYLIRIGGFGTSSGSGTLTLSQFTAGACCNGATGSCLPTLESTCASLGLSFLGWGTTCSVGACVATPTGACCNTVAGTCSLLTQAACSSLQLSFSGAGTTCQTIICQPVGACCRATSCSLLSSGICIATAGNFLGGGTTCSPPNGVNPCCRADFNNSGAASVQDLFDYLSVYFAGC